MPDQAGIGRNDEAVTQKQALTQVAVSSLYGFVVRIESSRHLMDVSNQRAAGNSVMRKYYQKQLSQKEMRNVEQLVEAHLTQLPSRVDEYLVTRRADNPSEKIDLAEVYPLANDLTVTGMSLLVESAKEELMAELIEGLQESQVKAAYASSLLAVGGREHQESFTGRCLIPALVSGLEEFIAGLLRAALMLHPQAFGTLPDLPYEIVAKYGKMEASTRSLHRWAVDTKVKAVMKGGPLSWQESIKKRTDIDLASMGADWQAVCEIIQRRHSIVHSNGNAT